MVRCEDYVAGPAHRHGVHLGLDVLHGVQDGVRREAGPAR